ncbi:MAG TPA: thiol-activated cytolysin family protein [Pyrinomonadaceae bacterium]|nr:thiol-activated cytolysin family protein [Pyrinomonadaceae bacterium]
MKNIIILVVVTSLLIAIGFSKTSVSTVVAKLATPMPAGTPEKPLTEDELSGLLDELKGGLTDLVGDEEKVTAITEKWDAREDLAGKTRKQVLGLLFADLRTVVTDKAVQNSVWAAWNQATPTDPETSTTDPPVQNPDTAADSNLEPYISGLSYDANRLLSVQPTGSGSMFEKVLSRDEQRKPGSGNITKCSRTTKSLSHNFTDILVLQPTRGVIYPGSLLIADRGLTDGEPRALASLARAPIGLQIDLPGAENDGSFTVGQPSDGSVGSAINGALGGWNNSGSYREGHVDTSRSGSNSAVAYSREQFAMGLGFSSDWAQGPVSGLINNVSNGEKNVVGLVVKQVFYTVSVDPPESPAGFFAGGVTAAQARAAFSSSSVPAYVSSVSYGRVMIFQMQTEKSVSAAEAEEALKYAAGLVTASGNQKAVYDNILAGAEITGTMFGAGGQVTTETIRAGSISAWIKGKAMTYSKANAGVPVSYTVNFLKDNAVAKVGTTTQYNAEDCRNFPNYWLEIRQNGAYMADYTVTWDEPGVPGKKQEGRFSAGNKMQVNFAGDATNIRIHLRTMSDWLIVNKVLQPNELNKAYQTGGHATGPTFSVVQN